MSDPIFWTDVTEQEDDLSGIYTGYRVEAQRLDAERRFKQRAARGRAILGVAEGKAGAQTPEGMVERPAGGAEQEGEGGVTGWDLLHNAVEIPTQILGGVIDDLPESLGETLDDVVNRPLLTLSLRAMGMEEEWTNGFVDQLLATPNRAPDIDIKMPETPTGATVRPIAEFFGGFIPALGQIRNIALFSRLGKIGRPLAEAAASGIVTGAVMDPMESALDMFVEQNPKLRGPIEEYMSSDLGKQSRVGARLRNSLVDAGFGMFADGMMAGLRGLARMRRARVEMKKAAKAAKLGEEGIDITDDMLSLGITPSATVLRGGPGGRRLVASKPTGGQLAAARLAQAEKEVDRMFPPGTIDDDLRRARAEIEATRFEINFDHINTSEDVERMMQDGVDIFTERIESARRGVVTNRETEIAADQMGLSLREVLGRRKGQNLNAAESLAFRKIHVAAGEKLEELARAAADPNAGALDLYKLRKMLAIYGAISEQVLGARAEAGRALQAWNITAESMRRYEQIEALLAATGGDNVNKALAQRIVQLADAGALPGQTAVMVRKGIFARTMDAVKESFVMGLLWRPATHLVNIMSPWIVSGMQVAERAAAGQISKALGRRAGEGVDPMEWMAYCYGMTRASYDMFSLGALRLRQAEGVRAKILAPIEALGELRDRMGIPRTSKIEEGMAQGAITSDALGINPASGWGRAVDAYGRLTRLPGAALGLEDDVGKIIGFSAELEARAYREAIAKGGTAEDIARRYAAILEDPPRDIRLASIDNSTYITFTNQAGDIAAAISAFRDRVPVVGPLLFPFVRTPANILNYSFQRTPLGIVSSTFWNDIKRGGATADLALARLSLGSLTTMLFMDYAMSGRITGSGMIEPGQRSALLRQNIQPDSIKFGENWYRYNRMDALGMQASFAATFVDILDRMDVDEEDMPAVQEIAAAASIASATSAMSKTWLFGISNFVMAMKYGESFGEQYLEKTLASMTPMTSALRSVTELTRDDLPDANTLWEHVMAQLPILEARLSRKQNLWGDIITLRGPYGKAFDFISPVSVREELDSPIDREIFVNQMDIRRISKRTGFPDPKTGQTVTANMRDFPRVYEALVWLSGQGAKIGGQGCRDALNDMVQGKGSLGNIYIRRSIGPEGVRTSMVRNTVERYRRLAKEVIMRPEMARKMRLPKEIIDKLESAEFVEFREHIGNRGAKARALLRPTEPTPSETEARVRIAQ